MTKANPKHSGFTIVELLVVIVVIGILATITIVAYTGFSQKAVVSSLESDLTNSANKLKLYYVDYGTWPADISNNCPTGPTDTNYCLKNSPGNSFSYSMPDSQTFCLSSANANGTTKKITNNSAPTTGFCAPTVTIGTQVWMKYNLNVGSKVDFSSSVCGYDDEEDVDIYCTTGSQTDNGIIEKFCYNNDESNCTTDGGLYQLWEATRYDPTEGAQGLCPDGFRIPTNAEWGALISNLGAGTAGAQLKPGGASHFDAPLAGALWSSNSFSFRGSYGYYWTSSAWTSSISYVRYLSFSNATVTSDLWGGSIGQSVRCIKG